MYELYFDYSNFLRFFMRPPLSPLFIRKCLCLPSAGEVLQQVYATGRDAAVHQGIRFGGKDPGRLPHLVTVEQFIGVTGSYIIIHIPMGVSDITYTLPLPEIET